MSLPPRKFSFDSPIRLEPGFFNIDVSGGTGPYQLQRWIDDGEGPFQPGTFTARVDIIWEDDPNPANTDSMVVRGGCWLRPPAGTEAIAQKASGDIC